MKLTLIFAIICTSSISAADIRGTSESILVNYFGRDARLAFSVYDIPDENKTSIEQAVQQRFFREKVHLWVISKNDSTIAIAVLDNVLGKAMPITFLVVFDGSGTIILTEIIRYREAIGGEISNSGWLKQFKGYSSKQSRDLDSQVDGISGATISVNSVTQGVEKLCLLFPHMKASLEKSSRE